MILPAFLERTKALHCAVFLLTSIRFGADLATRSDRVYLHYRLLLEKLRVESVYQVEESQRRGDSVLRQERFVHHAWSRPQIASCEATNFSDTTQGFTNKPQERKIIRVFCSHRTRAVRSMNQWREQKADKCLVGIEQRHSSYLLPSIRVGWPHIRSTRCCLLLDWRNRGNDRHDLSVDNMHEHLDQHVLLPNTVLAAAVGEHQLPSAMLGAFTPFAIIAAIPVSTMQK